MEDLQRKIIVEKMDSILDRVTIIDKERKTLVQEMKDILPIKEGDKISICNREGDKHVRFAFVNRIEIKLRGQVEKEKSALEFDLQKCKADGKISQHADYLKYNEYVTKIK